jgi:hypothetical protein
LRSAAGVIGQYFLTRTIATKLVQLKRKTGNNPGRAGEHFKAKLVSKAAQMITLATRTHSPNMLRRDLPYKPSATAKSPKISQ